MDGSYRLRHRGVDQLATLSVAGASFRMCVPPGPESKRSLDSHAAALAAMNAELVRLTGKGWTLVDIETGVGKEETPAPAPEEELYEKADRVAECVVRDGGTSPGAAPSPASAARA